MPDEEAEETHRMRTAPNTAPPGRRADRPTPGTADRPTPGTADRPTPGTADRPTPGTADRLRPGTADRLRPGTAGRLRPGTSRLSGLRGAVAACALAVFAAGCSLHAMAAPSLEITSAYVPQPKTPGMTSAYLDIRNNGTADHLIAARDSAGGHIALRVPDGHGMAMKTVPEIAIPSGTTVRLLPNGMHLLIAGATGRMVGGKDITLTLVFAHGGSVSVPAMVTNPETGGSSYFTN
jgi:copper(I)-binding protein